MSNRKEKLTLGCSLQPTKVGPEMDPRRLPLVSKKEESQTRNGAKSIAFDLRKTQKTDWKWSQAYNLWYPNRRKGEQNGHKAIAFGQRTGETSGQKWDRGAFGPGTGEKSK